MCALLCEALSGLPLCRHVVGEEGFSLSRQFDGVGIGLQSLILGQQVPRDLKAAVRQQRRQVVRQARDLG